jgi:hypothetical protein
MSQQEKDRLIGQLSVARNKTLEVIQRADLSTIIHADSGWQARDVLGHMAAWDYEAAASLRAYLEGRQYQVQADLGGFNEQSYQKRKTFNTEEVMADFSAAHDAFKSALLAVQQEKLDGPMTFAWGGHGTVGQMVTGMILHEEEHRHELAQALHTHA